MIDISDGLSTDLGHICRLSGVGAVIEAAAVPVSAEARSSPNPLEAALNDGEDFELLFALAPDEWETLRRRWKHPVSLTCIGRITADRSMRLLSAAGEEVPLVPKGYDHLVR
jgi:thiamine-monophosphate kinase